MVLRDSQFYSPRLTRTGKAKFNNGRLLDWGTRGELDSDDKANAA